MYAAVVVLTLSCRRYNESLFAFSDSPDGRARLSVYTSCTPPDCGMRIVASTPSGEHVLYAKRRDHLVGAVYVLWTAQEGVALVCNSLQSEPILVGFNQQRRSSFMPDSSVKSRVAEGIRRSYQLREEGVSDPVDWLCSRAGSAAFERRFKPGESRNLKTINDKSVHPNQHIDPMHLRHGMGSVAVVSQHDRAKHGDNLTSYR